MTIWLSFFARAKFTQNIFDFRPVDVRRVYCNYAGRLKSFGCGYLRYERLPSNCNFWEILRINVNSIKSLFRHQRLHLWPYLLPGHNVELFDLPKLRMAMEKSPTRPPEAQHCFSRKRQRPYQRISTASKKSTQKKWMAHSIILNLVRHTIFADVVCEKEDQLSGDRRWVQVEWRLLEGPHRPL